MGILKTITFADEMQNIHDSNLIGMCQVIDNRNIGNLATMQDIIGSLFADMANLTHLFFGYILRILFENLVKAFRQFHRFHFFFIKFQRQVKSLVDNVFLFHFGL